MAFVQSKSLPTLPPLLVADAVRAALKEDLGAAGDITSKATIPEAATAVATFGARQPGVLAGLALAACAFREIDPAIKFESLMRDGDRVDAGSVVARVSGPARGILSAERVALNYLCHLSGIATATAALVAAVSHAGARIADTRKTTPGLRAFEKYAVRCGGGVNHRIGLYDAVLIKDNHVAVAGGVGEAVRRARAAVDKGTTIEIEVTSLEELSEALDEHADVVMLDNMDVETMRQAVEMTGGKALLEASGNVTLETVGKIAETGVDIISSGWITHSAPALDLGLDVMIG
jgi:nicotinate-nucleotide pyrophosphorylase (carboxylating)